MREHAAQGVVLTLNALTKAMRTEVGSTSLFASPSRQRFRLQILTIGEPMAGKNLNASSPPETSQTYERNQMHCRNAGK